MKRLYALAVLLTSSLASAADGVADLEGQYYAGLNFGAGWGGGFKMKPSVVFGYHHDKNSKFELEVLANMSDIAKATRKIGASLLANYRFYPDLDIDPVKLYVSGGLGGYLQVIPFGFSKGIVSAPSVGGGDETGGGDTGNNTEGSDNAEGGEGGAISGATVSPIYANEEEKPEGLPLVDKVLGFISYKLKVGVDYEITPQIVGAVGVTMGGQLGDLKAKQIPDAVLEVGVRYNF